MKSWVIALLITAVAVPSFIIGTNMIATVTSVATAPGRVIQQTLKTDNIIQNYEWFYQQNADIEAQRQKIDIYQTSLDTIMAGIGSRTPLFFESQDISRTRVALNGAKSKLTQMIAAYNAASKMQTRNVFKDWNLPAEITL